MLSWPKPKGSLEKKSSKTISTSQSQQQQCIVISMPRRRTEFGMGTFGTEASDAVGGSGSGVAHDQESQPPTFNSTALPKISDQRLFCSDDPLFGNTTMSTENQENPSPQQQLSNSSTTKTTTATATPEVTILSSEDDMPSSLPLTATTTTTTSATTRSNSQQHVPQRQGGATSPGVLPLSALQQQNINNTRRDQSLAPLRTPGGTPATPNSVDLMTPHSVRSQTSYFPATPASGHTFATSSTNISSRSNATVAFGGGSGVHQLKHAHQQQRDVLIGASSNHNSSNNDNSNDNSDDSNSNSSGNNNDNSISNSGGLSGTSTDAKKQPTIKNDKATESCTTIVTAATPVALVPETRRQRHQRPDILPPAIITNPCSNFSSPTPPNQALNQSQRNAAAHQQHYHHHPHCCSTSQTPCTPHAHTHAHHLPQHHPYAPTPSAPMSAVFPTGGLGTTGFYPLSTPTAGGIVATPRTPSSMNEWRMMQLQLQQQDDLHFSLALPSVSTLSSLGIPPSSRMMSPASTSGFGLTPAMAGQSVAPSASSACSCCCSGYTNNASTTTVAHVNESAREVEDVLASETTAVGNHGAESAVRLRHHHSFLLSPSSPRRASVASALADAGTNGESTRTGTRRGEEANTLLLRQSSNHSLHDTDQQAMYTHGNISGSSSDYFTDRGIHTQSLEQCHGLEQGSVQGLGRGQLSAQGPLGGSAATFHSDYAPSSVDPSDFEHIGGEHPNQCQCHHHHRHNHSCRHHQHHQHLHQGRGGGSANESVSYGPSSAGSEAPLNQFLHNNDNSNPYFRSGPPAPASAFGGGSSSGNGKARPCRNCANHTNNHHHHHHHHHLSEVPTPTSATPSILKGGADMVASGSSTSLNGSVFLNPMGQQRPASPAPSQGGGPFRTLSSRLAASTLRKLSVSQKSLFSSSREDLLSGSSSNNGGWAGCSHCQQESGSVQDSMAEAEGGVVGAGAGCCCCCCGAQEGSVCSESGDPTNTTAMEAGSGSNCGRKAQRVQSKLRGLRGVSGSKHGHSKDKDKDKDKDKSRKASRKSRETDQSNPSQSVNQEFAHYNYERQIEDFQRAARIFKEQKALTAAAAAASMTAEVRAITRAASTKLSSAPAVVDTGKGRKAQGQQQQQTLQQSTSKSFASSSASVAITPIQEVEGESSPSLVASAPIHPFSITSTSANSCKNSTDSLHNTTDSSPDGNTRGRKKSIASSTRSGLLRPISRSHRRVGSSASTGANVGSSRGASAKDAAIAIISAAEQPPRKSYSCNNIDKSGRGNETSFGLDDVNYTSIGYGSKIFDPFTTTEGTEINGDVLALNIRTAVVVEDIPLTDMTKSTSPTGPLYSGNFPRLPDDVLSLKSRPSNISQVTRGRLEISISSAGMLSGSGAGVGVGRGHHSNGLKTGRSVHSVSSVDTVSRQIAARHRQHSHLAATANSPGSNIGSIYSQSHHQTLYQHTLCDASCIGIGDGGGMGTECGGMEDHLDQGVVLENSPIQVVRATVGTIDDTTLPCFTFRMWVLSTVFVVMGAAISEYNFFRSNSAYFSIYFVQLASYFCGKAMARWLPTREFEIRVPGLNWVVSKWKSWWSLSSSSSSPLPPFQESMDESDFSINSNNSISSDNGRRAVGGQSHGGPIRPTDRGDLSRSKIASLKTDVKRVEGRISWKFTLNPGKFNMKEHMLIGIAAAAGCSPAYATNVLAIQSLVFNSPLGISTGVGLVLSSQCIGFSMAWLLFDYVIKPSVMIWPATLVNVSLYNTLHEHKVLTRWFTRMQLFWYAFFAIFIYQWLPRMFMPVLTSMALLCWIKPSSNILRKLGSGYTGLGIGCISLDWSIISGVGPLYTPWWAQCNFFVGLIAMLWIVAPLVYFSDYWSAMSYPIVSSNLYDNTSQLYDVAMIVNKDLSFNLTMYEAYSPVVMTPYFAITYGTSFMAVVATFVHVALFYGSDIWLISSTRFSRKTQKLKEWAMGGLITRIFQGHGLTETNSSTCKDTAEESGATAGGRTAAGYSPDLRATSRKASGSLAFRNEVAAGGGVDNVGMGTISGLSFEERVTGSGFHQSSHYRQLSQQQECFSLPLRQTSAFSTSRRSSKQLADERDQIPTEMFGTEDIHTSLMRAYPEIPGWWFGVMFIVCFITAVFVCNAPEIRLPVYALVLALLLAAVFALPMAIIQALSSSQIGLNVLSEVVCGYLLPGNQLGNSVFKCYSYMALYQCLNLTQGFKLGHYMKVPPRQIFIAVVYGTILGAFVNLQVLEWVLLYNRQELFDADPKSGWSFRNLDLFFSASLLWGAISPKRLFAQGSIYHFLPYCFLLGILLPIPCYVMYRHYPPFGVVCKGDSRFWPFMPNCRCPPDYIAASQNGSAPATAAVYPKPYLRQRRDEGGQIGLEEGRSRMGRAMAAAFKPGKSRRRLEQQQQQQQQQEQQESMGQKTEPNDACYSSADERPSPSFDSAQPSSHNGGIHTPTTPTTPVPFTPATATTAAAGFNDVVRSHIYYGNPESALDDRLRRFSWNLVNTPLICVGASFVPQAPASFVVSAGVVAFCFAYLVLRYRHEWWRRYTFVLAAALDSGTQICNMAIFVVFSLILKGAVEFPNWLGNDAINPEKCGVGDGYN